MSFFLEDRNGYVGDIGSAMGLRSKATAARNKPAMTALLTVGTADRATVEKAITECAKIPELKHLVGLLKKSTPPVVITDGVED